MRDKGERKFWCVHGREGGRAKESEGSRKWVLGKKDIKTKEKESPGVGGGKNTVTKKNESSREWVLIRTSRLRRKKALDTVKKEKECSREWVRRKS